MTNNCSSPRKGNPPSFLRQHESSLKPIKRKKKRGRKKGGKKSKGERNSSLWCSVHHKEETKRYRADSTSQKTQLEVFVITARNSQHSLCSSSGNSGLSFSMKVFQKLLDCSQVLTGFPLSNKVRQSCKTKAKPSKKESKEQKEENS